MKGEEVGVGFMPSSTLANEASDFLSVANQLAASPHLLLLHLLPLPSAPSHPLPPPSSPFFLPFFPTALFVFHLRCLIKHDRDCGFAGVPTLCMTMQVWH